MTREEEIQKAWDEYRRPFYGGWHTPSNEYTEKDTESNPCRADKNYLHCRVLHGRVCPCPLCQGSRSMRWCNDTNDSWDNMDLWFCDVL